VKARRRIRAARPSDAEFLGEVLEMAGRGHLVRGPWDLMFPEPHERQSALRRIADGEVLSWCHRDCFRVLDEDGEACAAMVAFEPSALGGTSLAAPLFDVFAHLAWTTERISRVGPLLEPYTRCLPDMPAGTWIVENVGARPDKRRRGLVAELLEHSLEAGREQGFRRAQISCLVGNDPARRAYEKAGFEVVEELVDPAFEDLLGAPGFQRMTRTL
jgi:ribosomal protein S18 acetylase RimI-like enzyme